MIGLSLSLDAAPVSLNLAMTLLDRGDTAELKRLAAEMIPVFKSKDLLFQKAAGGRAGHARGSSIPGADAEGGGAGVKDLSPPSDKLRPE